MSFGGLGFAVIITAFITVIAMAISAIVKLITGVSNTVMEIVGFLFWGLFLFLTFGYFFTALFGGKKIEIGMGIFVLLAGIIFFGLFFGWPMYHETNFVGKNMMLVILVISIISSLVLGKKYPGLE